VNPRGGGGAGLRYRGGMAMKLHRVLDGLRQVAPEALAEPWDKVGLHVGSLGRNVSGGLLCIDLTEAVVAEAVSRRCELIVAYHPPIFHPLTRLVEGRSGTWKERALMAAVRHKRAVYAPHTALDAVAGGMNDWLCAGLGQGATTPIVPRPDKPGPHDYKIITFVPGEHADAVRDAMDHGGAGWIGHYRQCSFNTPGVGTFRPMRGAKPAIGAVGNLEWVEELRVEMICSGDRLDSALAALRQAHPYEEPAIDVFQLAAGSSGGAEERPQDSSVGAGRLLTLARPILAQTLAQRLKKRLNLDTLKTTPSQPKQKIRTVAVCVGAGGSLFEDMDAFSRAAKGNRTSKSHSGSGGGGADAYVTGEMQHHQVLDLHQRGKAVLLAGHTHTERPYLPIYREKIRKTAAAGVRWRLSRADRAPLTLR